MDIAEVLTVKFPGEEWTISGNDYDSLEWLSDSKKPTLRQLEKLSETVEADVAAIEQAKAEHRASALAKLAALGLTEQEINALTGGI